MRTGFLHSLIRVEEKYLLKELRKRNGIDLVMLDDRKLIFNLNNGGRKKYGDLDVVIERCINHSRALYSLKILNDYGIPTVNSYGVAETCGSKFLTSTELYKNDIPTPKVSIAYTEESALKAIDEIGYPVVLKPAVGSWGRLVSKINDREAAESILEHKKVLGSYHHSIYYIQEYIEKKYGRDIRSFVVGDEVVGAIYRTSEHWITNTSRGGKASNCPVTDELKELSLRVAEAVGGGILGIDLMETTNDGLFVNEVNYTVEFRNSIGTTGVNIPEKIVDYVLEVGRR